MTDPEDATPQRAAFETRAALIGYDYPVRDASALVGTGRINAVTFDGDERAHWKAVGRLRADTSPRLLWHLPGVRRLSHLRGVQ
jgi:hypothetical protein